MLLNVSLIPPFCCCVVFHLISTSVSLYSVIGEDLGCLQVLAVINIAVIHTSLYRFLYGFDAFSVSSVSQSCLTLCSPIDCSLPGSPALEFSSRNIGMVCHFLLKEIFLTRDQTQIKRFDLLLGK